MQQTFESWLRVLRPGGTLSSLGVYSGKLTLPIDAFAAGLVTTASSRHFAPAARNESVDQIEEAYELFGAQRSGVLKVAITTA